MNFGLIGGSLEHSFSKAYFEEKFSHAGLNNTYTNFEMKELVSIPQLIKDHSLDGFNVTIPHKENIIPYLDHLDQHAKEIGAVNAVKVIDGETYGHNTDHLGFAQTLEELISPQIQALILGTGGAAKAVAYALEQLGLKYQFVSRKGKDQLSYEQLNAGILNDHRLIINTTPLGMYPRVDECPNVPMHLLGHDHICYDLIYNPEKTAFLQMAESRGAFCINGKQMLINQAELSYKIWTDQ